MVLNTSINCGKTTVKNLYENNETLGRAQGIFVVGDNCGNAGWLHNVCRTDRLPGPTTTSGTTSTRYGATHAAATGTGAGRSGYPHGE
jgi:hypothetical protein